MSPNSQFVWFLQLVLLFILTQRTTAGLLSSLKLPYSGTDASCILSLVNQTALLKQAGEYFLTPDPELTMTVTELLEARGYPYETHYVTTEDGYILTVHRLSYSNKSAPATGKPPIILAHGFSCDSSEYLVLPSEMGLAYILVDSGYDVWMMNNRGTVYSRNSTKYKSTQSAFWNFSYNEMGEFDTPATIDYVTNQTGYKKVFFIGHSQGNMIYWVAASKHPEINKKVRGNFALGPAADLGALRPSWHVTCALVQATTILPNSGNFGFLPGKTLVEGIVNTLCGGASLRTLTCLHAICNLAGFSYNVAYLPKTASEIAHTFEGVSFKVAQHLCQNTEGTFREFDYGTLRNLKIYGSKNPPAYDLSKTTATTFAYHGSCDVLTTPDASEKLCSSLGGNTTCITVPGFNHMDLVYGATSHNTVYKHIMDTMQELLITDPE